MDFDVQSNDRFTATDISDVSKIQNVSLFSEFCVQIMPSIIENAPDMILTQADKESPMRELSEALKKLYRQKITSTAFKNICNQLEPNTVIEYTNKHPSSLSTYEATTARLLFGNETIFACIIANIFWCTNCKSPTADGHLVVNKYTRIDIFDENELKFFPNCSENSDLTTLKLRMYSNKVNQPLCEKCHQELIEKRAILYAPLLLLVFCEQEVQLDETYEFDRLPLEKHGKIRYKIVKQLYSEKNFPKAGNIYLFQRIADNIWTTGTLFHILEKEYMSLNEYIDATGQEIELSGTQKEAVQKCHKTLLGNNVPESYEPYKFLAHKDGIESWMSDIALEDYLLLIKNLTHGTERAFTFHCIDWDKTSSATLCSPELQWQTSRTGIHLQFYYTVRFILFPFLIDRHFCGTLFDRKKKIIIVLDSMKSEHVSKANIELCQKRYAFTMSAFGISFAETVQNWTIVRADVSVQGCHFQDNLYDCGFFFATAVLHIVTGVSVNSNTSFRNMREKLTAEFIVEKQIITVKLASNKQINNWRSLSDILTDIDVRLQNERYKKIFTDFMLDEQRTDETILDSLGRLDYLECCESVSGRPTVELIIQLCKMKHQRLSVQSVDNITYRIHTISNIIEKYAPEYQLLSRLTQQYYMYYGENNFNSESTLPNQTLLLPVSCVFLRHCMQE